CIRPEDAAVARCCREEKLYTVMPDSCESQARARLARCRRQARGEGAAQGCWLGGDLAEGEPWARLRAACWTHSELVE
ncbi:hypothetical protein, partial [Salmonella enterica]|uniref:hypothetical protein n=1 Tax=Salmonella enterica TaxID=28901 RepID=UPI0020C2652A